MYTNISEAKKENAMPLGHIYLPPYICQTNLAKAREGEIKASLFVGSKR
jgi:hypothetical protein